MPGRKTRPFSILPEPAGTLREIVTLTEDPRARQVGLCTCPSLRIGSATRRRAFTLLNGSDATQFRLEIEGYEFPTAVPTTNEDWDANWLVVGVEVKGLKGSWSAKGPYLTTWDVEELVSWFDEMSQAQATSWFEKLDFTEPDLEFNARKRCDGFVELRVLLGAEFSPPWKRESAGQDEVDLTIQSSALQAASAELRTELQRFPRR